MFRDAPLRSAPHHEADQVRLVLPRRMSVFLRRTSATGAGRKSSTTRTRPIPPAVYLTVLLLMAFPTIMPGHDAARTACQSLACASDGRRVRREVFAFNVGFFPSPASPSDDSTATLSGNSTTSFSDPPIAST